MQPYFSSFPAVRALAWLPAVLGLFATLSPALSAQTSGDFNGDGFDDLAIGVPYEDLSAAVPDRGAVHVLYGSPAGPTAAGSEYLEPGVLGIDWSVMDHFGFSLAAGDFNLDLFDDLAIGIPTRDVLAVNAGAVVVLFGSPAGLLPVAAPGPLLLTDSCIATGGPEAGDQFGYSLTAGDLDLDGDDDLAIGVPFEDLPAVPGADHGQVEIRLGPALVPPGACWNQDSPGIPNLAEAGDEFGFSLTAGDFDGDGSAELAVGVPFEDLGPVNCGGVNTLYRTPNLFMMDSCLGTGAVEAGDLFGFSMAAGDIDADGDDDLAIGGPGEDLPAVPGLDHGQVEVRMAPALMPLGICWHQDSPGVPNFAEMDDLFGFSLTAGNFDAAPDIEFAVGVPYEDNGPDVNTGAVNTLYLPVNQVLFDHCLATGGIEAGDYFGLTLSAGNFDGVGDDELAIGVPGEVIPTFVGPSHGQVEVRPNLGLIDPWCFNQATPGVADTPEPGDAFGRALPN